MKTCFKCLRSLPVDDFYRHPRMKDGRLGKCKECAKSDVSRNYRDNIDSKKAYEQARKSTEARKSAKREQNNKYKVTHPIKYKAHARVAHALQMGLLARKPCQACGSTRWIEAHHEDYSKPLEVVWLCMACHRAHHGKPLAKKEAA